MHRRLGGDSHRTQQMADHCDGDIVETERRLLFRHNLTRWANMVSQHALMRYRHKVWPICCPTASRSALTTYMLINAFSSSFLDRESSRATEFVTSLSQLAISPTRVLRYLITGPTFHSRLAREQPERMRLSLERTCDGLQDFSRPTERVWSPTQGRPRRPMDSPTLTLIVSRTLTLSVTLIA